MTRQRGSILLLALAFLGVLSVWVLLFHKQAHQSSWIAFRTEQERAADCFLDASIDEVLAVMQDEMRDPAHATTLWIRNASDTRILKKSLDVLPVTKSMIDELHQQGVLRIEALEVTMTKRVEDYRNHSPLGTYYAQEGQGTIIFSSSIKVFRVQKPLLSLTLERHHDYKVACFVSRRPGDASRETAQNRNLDYVLYVRDGLQEFRRTLGRMLNRSSFDLTVKPNGRGHVYFGNTRQQGPFVFLNVPAGQIPSVPSMRRDLSQAETAQMVSRILEDAPFVGVVFQALLDANEEKVTARMYLQGILNGFSPSLNSSFIPISASPQGATSTYVHDGLFDDPSATGNPQGNTEPGITIQVSGEEARHLLEGNIRKRFLEVITAAGLTEFLDNLGTVIPEVASSGFLAALPGPGYERLSSKRGKAMNPFVDVVLTVNKVLQTLPPAPLSTTVSRIHDEFPYGMNGPRVGESPGSSSALPEKTVPFQHLNLRSYSVASLTDLEALGFLEGNVLKAYGAIHVRSPIVLGERGPIRCSGRVLLSTSGDIIFKNGVSCDPGSVLILAAKGRIVIDTSERIEAAIAGRTVVVSPSRNLRLKGSLWVETLGSSEWPAGPHVIEFDAERFSRDQDLYAVNISSRLTFRRLTRSEP